MFRTGLSGDIEPATILNNLDFSGDTWSAEDRCVAVGDFDDTVVVKPSDGKCVVTGRIMINLNILMGEVLDADPYECERWLNEHRQSVDDFLTTTYGCRRGGDWDQETLDFKATLPAAASIASVAARLDNNWGVTNLLDDIHGRGEYTLAERLEMAVAHDRV